MPLEKAATNTHSQGHHPGARVPALQDQEPVLEFIITIYESPTEKCAVISLLERRLGSFS